MTTSTRYVSTATWTVETKTVKVRPGTLLDPWEPDMGEDEGHRYRYVCTCGHQGPWRKTGNDADGDQHLYTAHRIGD